MQKKIAIAVDGSLPAAQAVCYATTLAAFIKNLHLGDLQSRAHGFCVLSGHCTVNFDKQATL